MGVVKVDINRDFNIWNNINLSDQNTVRGLLRYRHKFDILFYENMLGSEYINYEDYSEDISFIYIDIDDIINNLNFTERQLKIIKLYQLGETEQEIAFQLDVAQSTINENIDTICKSITKENDWRYLKVMYLKNLELKGKVCKTCGEYLPAIDEFFTPLNITKDGLVSHCKKCRRKQTNKQINKIKALY